MVCRVLYRPLTIGPCSRCRLLPENSDRTLNVHICSIITTLMISGGNQGDCIVVHRRILLASEITKARSYLSSQPQKSTFNMTSYMARGYRIQRLLKQKNCTYYAGKFDTSVSYAMTIAINRNRISIRRATAYLSLNWTT